MSAPPPVPDSVRLDRWLWTARFYKTRSLAQAACQGGKVDVNGQGAKPSRAVRVGDRLRVTLGEWRRELLVRAVGERRGHAAAARLLYEDLSPPPPRPGRLPPAVMRAPGLGRPTKRERRLLDRFPATMNDASERRALLGIGVLSVLVILAVAALVLGPTPSGAAPPSILPTLNALLNGTSAVLLSAGYLFIRRRRVAAHRACMLSAFGVSTLFLISYVIYHAQAGSVPFRGQGWIRPVYFTLLISHIVLAVVIVPLALTTIYRAWTERFDRHRRIARWTLPIWLYVSVTGVLVYWMLYHLGPPR